MANRYPYKEEAELMQGWLEEIGIHSNIQIYEGATYGEIKEAGKYGISLGDWFSYRYAIAAYQQ